MRFNTLGIVREQPDPAKALFVGVFLYRCSTIAFPFYGAFLISNDKLSTGSAALVIAAFGVGALTADLLSSGLLHRVRADLVIKISIVVLAVLLSVIGLATSLEALLILTFLWGICYEAVTPASYAMITDIYRGRENKMAFACNRLAINLGMAVGPLIGGGLYSFAPASIFYGNVVALLITSLFIIHRIPVGERTPSEGGDLAARDLRTREDGSNKRFAFAFVLSLPLHIAFALPPPMVGVLVLDTLGESAAWVSGVFLLNTLMIITLEVPLNDHLVRWRSSTILLIAFVVSGLGFIGMGLSPWPFWLLLATACWTVGEMTIFPTFLSYVDQISPRSLVKRNMGFYSAGVNVGLLVAPPAALAITQLSGGLPWVLAGTALVGSGVVLLLARDVHSLWRDKDLAAGQQEEQSPGLDVKI